MIRSAEHFTKTEEELNPDAPQKEASNPEHSVWVGASAGTGKTKILTDRVLRLLLPRANGQTGSAPHKILCLTFTKAAASEMALRLFKILSRWAVIPQEMLERELENLLERMPKTQDVSAARRLFAQIVDMPGGIKIMTIHAFCQSVLGRFPLEAGLSPHFTVLEEPDADALLAQAQQKIVQQCTDGKDPDGLFHRLAAILNEEQFMTLLSNMTSERHQFVTLLERHFGVEGLYTALCAQYGIPPSVTPEALLVQHCEDMALERYELLRTARLMIEEGNKTDQKAGQAIADWLSLAPETRSLPEYFEPYSLAFLKKQDGEIRAKLCGKAVGTKAPEAPDILAREARRLQEVRAQINAAYTAALTRDLCILAEEILNAYEAMKAKNGVLDFDDLILRTLSLLRGEKTGAAWVHYKLDQGLDHILVDEAQDTNPEQWEIVEALCDDFFAGQSLSEENRTLFVVGDEKQSIYSFQRASPEEFERMKQVFAQKIHAAQKPWSPVDLNISFRSTHSVLQAVDHVFAPDSVRRGLGQHPIRHHAFRRGQAGRVEIWPLFESDESPLQNELWNHPVETEKVQTGTQKLASHIAQKIKTMTEDGEILESHGRTVKPGDIMILLRKRGVVSAQISKALKLLGIPVGGTDRMLLKDELAVQDLMAAARFALLPEDDLNLACLLKSPLVNMDEQALYDLAYDRPASLWEAVIQKSTPELRNYLRSLIRESGKSPHSFLSRLLQSACPADPLSGRRAFVRRLGADALDPIDELLNAALFFEKKPPASLQKFICAQERGTSEIKREQEEGGTFVRIMTVHGSKGLQAPVVILPDTASTPRNAPNRADKRFLWPRQTGLDLPLWSPYKETDTPLYTQAMDSLNARLDDEYRRLLYVAMTRAEDRLYVAGCKGKRDLPEDCWYALVRAGLKNCPETEEREDGTLRLAHRQLVAPDREDRPESRNRPAAPLPEWLYSPAPAQENAMSVHNPSRLEDTADSPVHGDRTQRFLRGNLTHKLLQILPDLPPERREDSARHYLKRYGAALAETVRNDIEKETLALLHDPALAELFGPDSCAEVPVAGYLEGIGPVSGRIDRLVVLESAVHIVDYKTNRPPPRDPSKIPESYHEQMRLYAALLREIYPGKTVRAFLLWTDGPILMPVPLGNQGQDL